MSTSSSHQRGKDVIRRSVSGTTLYKLIYGKLEAAFEAHYDSIVGQAEPETMEGISGEEFELKIAAMLETCGCRCEMTPRTGDQGADLIVHYRTRRIAVQTKRWSGTVGNSAVQEVIAARKLYHCTEAWVVTNSRFTKGARVVAVAFGVILVEGTELGRLCWILDRERKGNETLFPSGPETDHKPITTPAALESDSDTEAPPNLSEQANSQPALTEAGKHRVLGMLQKAIKLGLAPGWKLLDDEDRQEPNDDEPEEPSAISIQDSEARSHEYEEEELEEEEEEEDDDGDDDDVIVFSPDALLENADWTKRTWDIHGFNSAEEFRKYLEKTGSSVEKFKKLPAYKATINRPDWLDDL